MHSTQGQDTAGPRGAARRLAVAVAAIALALTAMPATGAQAQDAEPRGTDRICDGEPVSDFDDIDGSAHEDNIRCMADRGLTEGTNASGGESYAPRTGVTRDQMASFIARFIEDYTGEDLEEGDDDRFDDVGTESTHASNINKLANIDVVEGTRASDGQSYAPRAQVTRDQMAAFIRRALSWLDDGDARNDSAPEPSDTSWFDDTEGSVHEPDIDAIAAERIVAGFGDGEYRPRDVVFRDQMASFVMRAYDFALEAGLDGPDDTPPSDGVAIVSPTEQAPLLAVSPGDTVEIAFETDRAGDYTLEYRDPAPEGGLLDLFFGGDDEPGDWTAFDGDETSGSVDDAGTHAREVVFPDEEDDEGVRDLRLTFEYDSTTVTVTEDSALVIGDGVVINNTQESLHPSIQDAVDEAEDGDVLLAIGEFEELVEIEGISDLGLGALAGTTLSGSIVANDADGLTLSDLIITDYETVVDEPTFGAIPGLGELIDEGLFGEEIGLSIGGSQEVLLADLTLLGTGADDIGLAAGDGLEGALLGSDVEGNDLGVLVAEDADLEVASANTFTDNTTGIDVRADEITVAGNTFEGNTTGVIAFGGFVEVTENTFDASGNVSVDLIRGNATVEDNTFGADDAEHICWPNGEYAADPEDAGDAFEAANAFEADELRVREEDDGNRWCLGPPEDEENGDAENGDEE
jgi:hypothetical protein